MTNGQKSTQISLALINCYYKTLVMASKYKERISFQDFDSNTVVLPMSFMMKNDNQFNSQY